MARSSNYDLIIHQQPEQALVTSKGKEKARKPVDPPPIVEIKVRHCVDPTSQYLHSPYYFMTAGLVADGKSENEQESPATSLAGQMVSSLHRLKNTNNEDGGFFVFGDLSIRVLGMHRLVFSLFEMQKTTCEATFLKQIISKPFPVVLPKEWKGLDESTYLSRAFSDQGVRLRLRKEPRTIAGNRRVNSLKRGLDFSPPAQEGTGTTRADSNLRQVDQHTHNARGIKRQRSDSEYSPQLYPPSNDSSINGYFPNADGRTRAMRTGQNYAGLQNSYGMGSIAQPLAIPYNTQSREDLHVQSSGWSNQYTQYNSGAMSAPAAPTYGFSNGQSMLGSSPFAYQPRPQSSNYGRVDNTYQAHSATLQSFKTSGDAFTTLGEAYIPNSLPTIANTGYIPTEGSSNAVQTWPSSQFQLDVSNPLVQYGTGSTSMEASSASYQPGSQFATSQAADSMSQYGQHP